MYSTGISPWGRPEGVKSRGSDEAKSYQLESEASGALAYHKVIMPASQKTGIMFCDNTE